jgi:hypothetical protein
MGQVSNAVGSAVSEGALVEVEALDILSIIEHFVEDRQITFRTLFMQFNRSTVRASLVRGADLWRFAA